MATETKQCRTFKQDVRLRNFGTAIKNKDGLNINCKPCAQDKVNWKREERGLTKDIVLGKERHDAWGG